MARLNIVPNGSLSASARKNSNTGDLDITLLAEGGGAGGDGVMFTETFLLGGGQVVSDAAFNFENYAQTANVIFTKGRISAAEIADAVGITFPLNVTNLTDGGYTVNISAKFAELYNCAVTFGYYKIPNGKAFVRTITTNSAQTDYTFTNLTGKADIVFGAGRIIDSQVLGEVNSTVPLNVKSLSSSSITVSFSPEYVNANRTIQVAYGSA